MPSSFELKPGNSTSKDAGRGQHPNPCSEGGVIHGGIEVASFEKQGEIDCSKQKRIVPCEIEPQQQYRRNVIFVSEYEDEKLNTGRSELFNIEPPF